jgi:hypothetical protein
MIASSMSRRETLGAISALSLAHLSCGSSQTKSQSIEAFLGDMALTKALVDQFLDPDQPNWAMFDPELGYRHHDAVMKDGIDGSYAIYTMESTGERKRVHYANRPCRLNTYGNSFTHCDQVSDPETWQEYLAAHFAEPVRNYGSGGYGVYQAYRRMLREEATPQAASHMILNIWIDDHRRSLMASRWFHLKGFRDRINRNGDKYFHTNPWCHVRLDPQTGELQEYDNQHNTPESLYRLCDKDYLIETFRDDLFAHIQLVMEGGQSDKMEEMRQLSNLLELDLDWQTTESAAISAEKLFWRCGMKTSEHIVKKAQAFADKAGKKLLFLLSYRSSDIINACKGRPRLDQYFVDFLNREQVPYVDGMQKHVDDFAAFSIPPDQYVKRYWHGHYGPAGNLFFAFAIKNELLDWLDPKPVTYGAEEPSVVDIAATLAE